MEFLLGDGVRADLVRMVFERGFAPCAVNVALGGLECDAEEVIEVGVGCGVVF